VFGSSRLLMLYSLRRLAAAVPLVLGVIVVNFFLMKLAPGDPVFAMIGDVSVPIETIEMLRAKYHLSDPPYVQLYIYLRTVLSGDLGQSYFFRESVATLIWARLPPTLLLTLFRLPFSHFSVLPLAQRRPQPILPEG